MMAEPKDVCLLRVLCLVCVLVMVAPSVSGLTSCTYSPLNKFDVIICVSYMWQRFVIIVAVFRSQ